MTQKNVVSAASMNPQGLLWNLHCATSVVLREQLNFKSAVIRSERSSCLLWSSHVSWQEILLSFSIKFLSIFVHISGSIESITLIWVSLERSFPPAEVKRR